MGIFTGTSVAVQAVAVDGGAAPGGGTYGTTFSLNPAINGAGQVAFRADVVSVSASRGVFAGVAGAVQAVALDGTTAPGGGLFDNLFNPMLNGSGHVAFLATLTGSGVTAADNQGLYAGQAGGLVKIVRTGEQVDVDPGAGVDLRTVSSIGFNLTGLPGGEDGRGLAFNDSGLLAYRLFFTDGTSGVFTSQFTPVPEPAAVGLLAASGLATVGWLRRQGGRRRG